MEINCLKTKKVVEYMGGNYVPTLTDTADNHTSGHQKGKMQTKIHGRLEKKRMG
jgi:hypothetical protein